MPPHEPPIQLDALVRHSADVIIAMDDDGTITYHNPATERILGYDEGELVDESVLEYVHPADRTRVLDTIQATDGTDATSLQFRVRHADGLWVPVEATVSEPDDTDHSNYVVNAREITDREAFDSADERFADRMGDGFLSLDEKWRVTYLNETAQQLLDRDAEDLLGAILWEAFPEAGETEIHQQFHEAMDTQEAVAFETYYEPLQTTFEIRAYPSSDGLSVYLRDVSEHRRLANELRDSVDALHELYEIASATDLSFEDKCSQVLDLGRQRLGLPYAFLTRITEDTQTIVTAKGDHELLQPGESCPIEESYCRKTIKTDGLLALFDASEEGFTTDPAYQRFGLGCYIGSKIVVDGDLYGTICFAGSDPRDREFSDSERTFVELTSKWLSYELEQRRYQAELERQNDRLEQFASVLSHDLRNPLSVVEGHLDLERQQRDSENLQTASDALDRAFDLIDEVLEIARLGQEVTETEPLSLSAVAADAWEMVDHDDVELVVEDASTRVAADRDRLQRLLENLFRNSVEHGSTGSRTQSDDSVEHGGSTLTTVRVGAIRDGFYVEDDGAGIPEDEREQVFEGGYTTTREGTGFGLSIVEQIAEAHGWSVTVTNAADGGARFEFEGTDPSPT